MKLRCSAATKAAATAVSASFVSIGSATCGHFVQPQKADRKIQTFSSMYRLVIIGLLPTSLPSPHISSNCITAETFLFRDLVYKRITNRQMLPYYLA